MGRILTNTNNEEAIALLSTLRKTGPEVEIAFVRCELDSFQFRPSAAVHAVRWSRPAQVDLAQVLAGDREFLTSLGAG